MNKYVITSLTLASVFALSVASGVSGAPETVVAAAALPGSGSETISAMAMPARVTAAAAATDMRPDCVALPMLVPDKNEPRPAFEIGDKMKVTFYETVQDTEKNKWNKAAPQSKSFQQRTEFTGEYSVQDDATIAVPLLGSISVEGRNPKQLVAALQAAFKEFTGHDGFVTVNLLERSPIYVLGPVKNPGSYKYASGMTVLHALAMAGGIDTKAGTEPWQKLEAVREISKRGGALESMADLLVREAVLKSERDKVAPRAAVQLVSLVGEERASRLISAEVERRMAIVQARRERDRAVSRQLDAARNEVQDFSGRLKPIDNMIRLRKDRVAAYETLMKQGNLARGQLMAVSAELSDAEDKRNALVLQQSQAEQRVAQLEQDKARIDADSRGDLDTAILAISQQVSATARDADASGNILGALNVKYQPAAANSERYEIVRQTAKGPITMASRDVASLRPGDLVKVVGAQPGTADTPDRAVPVPASPAQAQNISATNEGCKPAR